MSKKEEAKKDLDELEEFVSDLRSGRKEVKHWVERDTGGTLMVVRSSVIDKKEV